HLPDGSNDFYPEERPVRETTVEGFWVDRRPATVAEFRRFVKETGHVSWAELAPRAEDYPDAEPEDLVPGSLLFRKADGPVDLRDVRNWWSWSPGADWRHPEGPGSNAGGRELHPVTHVAYSDALAYAEWAGKALPTEAEWEYAARGGLEGATYAWGDEFAPKGRMMANTWQGEFPWQNLLTDGYEGTSPVERYPPNGFGLYDMAGNVWEWTRDWYRPDSYSSDAARGLVRDPRGPSSSVDPSEPGVQKRVQRGGSYLCTNAYCTRYMVGSRGKGEPNSPSGHVGFRCVKRPSNAAL
ncbi:MAG TPA: formylglycine-generating enzyme family protein, partial [Polyangiaceae bacterium]|nr:formylglycine-generating enzyme family protein [Polyangiaceae bacterium]